MTVKVDSLREELDAKMSKPIKINEVSFYSHQCPSGLSGDELRAIALHLREKRKNSVIALTSVVDEKVVLVVATDDESRRSGVKAGALAKIASQVLGGGGGGKDDFAQGGGIKTDAIAEALKVMTDSLRN